MVNDLLTAKYNKPARIEAENPQIVNFSVLTATGLQK